MQQVSRARDIFLLMSTFNFWELAWKLIREVREESFVRKFREFRSERRLRRDA